MPTGIADKADVIINTFLIFACWSSCHFGIKSYYTRPMQTFTARPNSISKSNVSEAVMFWYYWQYCDVYKRSKGCFSNCIVPSALIYLCSASRKTPGRIEGHWQADAPVNYFNGHFLTSLVGYLSACQACRIVHSTQTACLSFMAMTIDDASCVLQEQLPTGRQQTDMSR